MTLTPAGNVRVRLPFTPTWNRDYEKWSRGFIRAHKWRVDRLHDEDDLLQEAWITFNYVANAYPREMDPDKFLALFKRAMINKMHDRSCRVKRRKNSPEGAISCDITEVLAGRIGETSNNGYVAAVMNEAPEELKLVLSMTIDGKLEPKHRSLRDRKSLSMRMRDFLNSKGIYSAFSEDPVASIKALFS